MRSFDELERGWQALPPRTGRRGTVRLVVARLGKGEHEVLAKGQLTVEQGLVGDRWIDGSKPSIERQLTLMDVRSAELVVDDQPLHMPGDNLLVDLDLDVATAPPGTRIRVGEAVVEVTAKPHTGCLKFKTRFGEDALRWINHDDHAARRLRGINARVVQPGAVAPGDVAEVVGSASEA
ncbi:MAG: MOSC domain-containing protein [Myxococcota bacterium]